MRIATILFTYKRPRHTQQVLDGLAQNTTMPEKLYIFQDGLKTGQKNDEWLAVKEIIHNVGFCPVEVIESDANKGLAKSVVDGISYVLKDYDAVIVLEDDCVPMPSFVTYMIQALEFYQGNPRINAVSGYSFPIFSHENYIKCFFVERVSTWGWGIWKNCWEEYRQDHDIIKRILKNKEAESRLNVWGQFDLSRMLEDRINGKNDSWAVYWALIAIEKDEYTLMLNKSLIKNIGFDGTGVHCGSENNQVPLFLTQKVDEFNFPLDVHIDDQIKKAAINYFGNGFFFNNGNPDNEHISIYGAGNCLQNNCRYLYRRYYIVNIFDKWKKGYFGLIPIKGLEDIDNICENRIIIMIENQEICENVRKDLMLNYYVKPERIVTWQEIRE